MGSFFIGDFMDDLIAQIKTWALVAALSMFGGMVDAIRRYPKEGTKMSLSGWMIKTLGDLFIASFAGFLTFWLYLDFTGSKEMTGILCASVSMSGYLGGKAIDIFTAAWERVISNRSEGMK